VQVSWYKLVIRQAHAEIIQYAVWLYHRFNLSHRDIEDLLAERGNPGYRQGRS